MSRSAAWTSRRWALPRRRAATKPGIGPRWPPTTFWQPAPEKTEKWKLNVGLLWAAAGGDLLILASDRAIAALELSSGQRVWGTDLADSRAAPRSWREAPLKPLLADGRIYLRRWSQRGPGLVCLDLDHGKTVWDLDHGKPAADPDRGKKGWSRQPKDFVVSNPLADRGRVLALTLSEDRSFPERRGKKKLPDGREPQRWTYWQLSLVSFDPSSGQVLQRWPIVWLRDPGGAVPACQAIAAGDQIVASLPGVVLSIDRGASIRWVRRLRRRRSRPTKLGRPRRCWSPATWRWSWPPRATRSSAWSWAAAGDCGRTSPWTACCGWPGSSAAG